MNAKVHGLRGECECAAPARRGQLIRFDQIKNSYFMETQQIERTLNALQRTPRIERT